MAKPHVDADWDVRAMAAAISSCKDVVSPGAINPRATIGSLSDVEWGWIAAAAHFGYVKVRAMQAVAEGTDYDATVRRLHNQDPPPWDAGAIETIMPILAEMNMPWSNPIGSWPRSTMVKFCHRAYQLVVAAFAARDVGQTDTLTRKLSTLEVAQREASAAAGGGLLSPQELGWDLSPHPHDGDLNDEIPF